MSTREKFQAVKRKEFDPRFCPHCGKPQIGGKANSKTILIPKSGQLKLIKKKKGCCNCTKRMKDIILALVVRALFAAHGLIGIWRAQTEWDLVGLWLLLIPVGVLVLEALFTVGIRGGEEYKWISPCVFLYLCGVVPSIWFLELKNFEIRQGYHYCNDLFWGNLTTPGCRASFQSMPYADVNALISNSTQLKDACQLERNYLRTLDELRKNGSLVTTPEPMTAAVSVAESGATTAQAIDGLGGDVVNTIEGAKKALDNLLSGVNIFDRTTWVLVLHQLLLFILIIGRWLLPTGEGISRDELSQLLLVFIGVGADILEFVTETIKETAVRCDKVVIICIMAFWSWSTLQFTLVLTAAQARKSRAVGIYEGEGSSSSRVNSPVVVVEGEEKEKGAIARFFTNTEVWGIMSTLILQDGPFLGMRLYIMVGKQVVHQMIVFFTCKNCLVVILQLYRLIIIATSSKDDDEEEEEVIANPNIDTVKALVTAQSKFKMGLKKKQGESSSTVGTNGKSTSKVAPSEENGKDLPGANKEVA